MLGHARRDQHRGERCGPRAAGADRGGSEQPAKARLAGTHSLVDLQAAINRYLTEHNQCPKPFIWTADPNRIIEKVNRGHQASASDH